LTAALGVAREEIATDDVWITERTDRRIAVVALTPGDAQAVSKSGSIPPADYARRDRDRAGGDALD
jgi:hypothetical protein